MYILAVLSLLVFSSEWLVRHRLLRHVGSALLVIVLGAITSNLGLIPTSSTAEAPIPVYDAIFAYVAPIAIFWLLLHVNLRNLLRTGVPLILLFLVGSLASLLGAIIAIRVVNGAAAIGTHYAAIAGMFTGTYVGGSVNFNAIALHYDVMRNAVLYGGAVVVDNIVTTLWIVATLALPRLLAVFWSRRVAASHGRVATGPIVDLAAEEESVNPRGIAVLIALGVGALWLAQLSARALANAGITLPPILIITTFALLLAQIPAVSQLRGARAAGMYAVYMFLAVIGAFCDVRAMAGLGMLGIVLLGFAALMVTIHGAIIFGAAWLFRMDLESAAVASQANVGGATSALALAKSLGREDLLVPAILLGALGTAIGTFLGFFAVQLSG